MSQPIVIYPNGVAREVTNLGWLLRHAAEVRQIRLAPSLGISAVDSRGFEAECMLTAYLADGSVYQCEFADASICRRWINRPSLLHAEVIAPACITCTR